MGTAPVVLSIHRGRIDVDFPYDRDDLFAIQAIPGRSWQKKRRMNTVPLDVTTCHILREKFGDRLRIQPDLRTWAAEAVRTQRNLGKIAAASTAQLEVLPSLNARLYEAIHLGPLGPTMTSAQRKKALSGEASFQAADVAFMAQSPAPLNANQPGMGKTFETIAAVHESGNLLEGSHLVVAPVAALETVWGDILSEWQDLPVFVAGGNTREERYATLNEAWGFIDSGPCWVVVNQHQLFDITRKEVTTPAHPIFQDVMWQTMILDEVHDMGFRKPKNASYKRTKEIRAVKRMALTGTPMGGKAVNLFAILQFLRPETFTSKWSWAGRWLHVTENEFGKKICDGDRGNCPVCESGILKERLNDFYESLIPYMLRRTKEEELKWLPPKQYVDLWVSMTPTQKKVYDAFEKESFVQLEEGDEATAVAGVGTLDMFTRLRQFASTRCVMEGRKVRPTQDSGKLPALMEILEERGIREKEPWGEDKVIIFSQFEEVVTLLTDHLRAEGVDVLRLTGKESRGQRVQVQRQFQADDGPRVIVMTTGAGGVSITLDKADTVIFFDQTWNPDKEEQAEDRAHRGGKRRQVTIYYLRTKETVEEYVFDKVVGKQLSNFTILDLRRKIASKA